MEVGGMSWLERLNDRNTRRLARGLSARTQSVRDVARGHLSHFVDDAGDVAGAAARQAVDYGRAHGAEFARQTLRPYAQRAGRLAAEVVDYGRHDGADTMRRYAHRAGELASEALDYGRQEGTLLARAATTQALRAGRALRADPVPLIVGAVGVALFANLLFGRRRD